MSSRSRVLIKCSRFLGFVCREWLTLRKGKEKYVFEMIQCFFFIFYVYFLLFSVSIMILLKLLLRAYTLIRIHFADYVLFSDTSLLSGTFLLRERNNFCLKSKARVLLLLFACLQSVTFRLSTIRCFPLLQIRLFKYIDSPFDSRSARKAKKV